MKKGISLIILVITIIVMIIIAGVVIVNISDSNIIDKANDAVNKVNFAQMEELAKTAYSTYILKGETGNSVDYIKNYLLANGISQETLNKYNISAEGAVTLKEEEKYTITINSTPSDASIVLTAMGYEQIDNNITVKRGTSVSYLVSKEGYETSTGIVVAGRDETVNVILTEKQLTIIGGMCDIERADSTNYNGYIEIPKTRPLGVSIYGIRVYGANTTDVVKQNISIYIVSKYETKDYPNPSTKTLVKSYQPTARDASSIIDIIFDEPIILTQDQWIGVTGYYRFILHAPNEQPCYFVTGDGAGSNELAINIGFLGYE